MKWMYSNLQNNEVLKITISTRGGKSEQAHTPVPLQKVRKDEEPVCPLRSKVPEGINTIKILLAHSSKQSLQTF